MKALVTGATGFIGQRLVRRLDDVVVLSRDAERARRKFSDRDVAAYAWDPQAGLPPPQAFDGVEVVFHLAGESVAEGRWTAAKKRRIRDSRVVGTRNLVTAIGRLATRPEALVSASAVGFYGNRGDETLTEAAPPGDDFLARVCVAWEQEARHATDLGLRVVNPRIGIVLGADGGAAAKMAKLFRLGLGSPLGSGRQWMPWIHVDDQVQLLLFLACNDKLKGPVNCAAPESTTNREFTKVLGRVLHRPVVLPAAPAFALRTALGEFATALLASQRVSPQAALAGGFNFQFKSVQEALLNVFGS